MKIDLTDVRNRNIYISSYADVNQGMTDGCYAASIFKNCVAVINPFFKSFISITLFISEIIFSLFSFSESILINKILLNNKCD